MKTIEDTLDDIAFSRGLGWDLSLTAGAGSAWIARARLLDEDGAVVQRTEVIADTQADAERRVADNLGKR